MHRTTTVYIPLLIFSLALTALSRTAAAVTLDGFATMGASETQGNAYNGSWVPYLALDRGLNFGGPSMSYNRAVGGATTTSLLSQGQHNQVHDLVRDNGVDVAFLFIGGNDFGSGSPIPVAAQLALGLIDKNTWAAGMVDRMMIATDKVLEAHPQGMIVAGLPDMTLMPAAGQYLPSATPEMIQNVVDAIDLTNSLLKQAVFTRGLVFLDTAQALRDLNAAPPVVGGVQIQMSGSSSDPRWFFQDGLHPAVAGNGIFANLMITAINKGFDQNIALLSDQTILSKNTTLNALYTGQTSNLDYGQYVHVVPEPSSLILVGIAAAGLSAAALRRRTNRRRLAA